MLVKMPRRVPSGLVSYDTREAHTKIQSFRLLESLFYSWGFDRVIPPTITYSHSLETERMPGGSSLRLINHLGEELRLRSDITLAIAQAVASRSSVQDLPLNMYYIENTFQDVDPGYGHLREKTQAGVEIFGGHQYSNILMILLSYQALVSLTRNRFRIAVGHIGFTSCLIDFFQDLTGQPRVIIEELFLIRDWPSISNLVFQKVSNNSDINSRQILQMTSDLLAICQSFGGRSLFSEIRGRLLANHSQHFGKAIVAIEQMAGFFEKVNNLSLSDFFFCDLGLYKSQRYYTGVVFEGYVAGAGDLILSGGCYDNLISHFCDQSFPAVGFAINIDSLLPYLQDQTEEVFSIYGKQDKQLFYCGHDLLLADQIRRLGWRIHNRDANFAFENTKAILGECQYLVIEKNAVYQINRLPDNTPILADAKRIQVIDFFEQKLS